MKVTLKNGSTVELPFSAFALTGYVATEITLNGKDVRAMRNMLVHNPKEFEAMLLQLEARFPENRLSTKQLGE